jgi:hypothetical protein
MLDPASSHNAERVNDLTDGHFAGQTDHVLAGSTYNETAANPTET